MFEVSMAEWILTVAFAAAVWRLYMATLPGQPGLIAEDPRDIRAEGTAVPATIGTGNLGDMLQHIRQAGGYADLDAFTTGAKLAYERITAAFATGTLEPVNSLLAPPIQQAFAQAIADRRSRDEITTMTLIGFLTAEPINAGLDGGTAWIEMRFTVQLVSATTDCEGKVVAGDSRRIAEMSEAWTFARDICSRDPNWILVATAEDE